MIEVTEHAIRQGVESDMLSDRRDGEGFHNSILEAFGIISINPESDFQHNTLFLGAGVEHRAIMLGNVAEIGYGLRKIEDFSIKNPNLKDLHKAYNGSFEREFNITHPIKDGL